MSVEQSVNRFERQEELVPRDRLADAKVTIIGVGSIGRNVAVQLASIGVPRLQIVDFDIVDLSNVTTQGYLASDVGRHKVDAAADAVACLDPSISVQTVFDCAHHEILAAFFRRSGGGISLSVMVKRPQSSRARLTA